MTEQATNYQCDGLVLSIDEIIITSRFVRTIETAHEKGVALLLAMQLVPRLDHHYEKHGSITATELDSLIVEAAKAVIKEPLS